jgi:2-polyprenyl-3-methyl-5-hydroxy-6-metoxy-1,4-benzoquinol methylase
MDEKTKKNINKHYNDLYKKYGLSYKSLGWIKGKQKIRFQSAIEIGQMNNSQVLDVGCGFGDLVNFLKIKNKRIKSYTGIDINPDFIEIAKKKHPKNKFKIQDIEEKSFRTQFDWIFAIGLTNQSGSYQHIEKLMKAMLKNSRKGIVMDFLSTNVDYIKKGNFHADPNKIFKIANRLSKRVVLRHDYLPFEFCVYIYKNDQFNKKLAFKDKIYSKIA